MIKGQKIVVVMPAYNAASTLYKTYAEIPFDIVDEVILVDDASQDNTAEVAKAIGIAHTIVHEENKGYGGNQKTCYSKALELGADIVIMVHPDYQYTPKLIYAMAALIAEGVYDCVLASRILGGGAIAGGRPRIKYIANRTLTFLQNITTGRKLSEYHTGFRGFSRNAILACDFQSNADDFIFDNQMLLQIIKNGKKIGEISCPTRYATDSSSIGGWPVIRYGLGVVMETVLFFLSKLKLPVDRYRIKSNDSAAQ